METQELKVWFGWFSLSGRFFLVEKYGVSLSLPQIPQKPLSSCETSPHGSPSGRFQGHFHHKENFVLESFPTSTSSSSSLLSSFFFHTSTKPTNYKKKHMSFNSPYILLWKNTSPKTSPYNPPLNPPTHPTVRRPPAAHQATIPRRRDAIHQLVALRAQGDWVAGSVVNPRFTGRGGGSGKMYGIPSPKLTASLALNIGQIKRPQKENSSSKHLFSGVILLVTRRVLMYTLMKLTSGTWSIWSLNLQFPWSFSKGRENKGQQ